MKELTDAVNHICASYRGYMKFGRLLRLVERTARAYDVGKNESIQEFISHTLFLVYEMGIKEKIYGVCEEAANIAEGIGLGAANLGFDLDTIAKHNETFKAKVEAKKIEIEKAKKSQKKDIVRIEYFNLGELYYENGQMQKAAEAYRISYCFSVNTEDLVKVSIKLGTVSIYNQNYTFGLKFVKEAVFKDLESPQNTQTTNLLNTIQALLYIGNNNLHEAATCLWELPSWSSEELSVLSSENDLAFYAIISGLLTLQRKRFKEDYYSKPNFRILLENFSDMLDLGTTYINFDFDKYFKLLSQFHNNFRHDYYLTGQISMMMQKCKKKVLVTYITPYKTVDLTEMADSFGMSLEDTERACEELIETNEIKYKINKYNKSLSAKTEDYKLESFKKAVKVGEEFIKGMESMLLKYHLRKKSSIAM
jgi:hypothetical protein